MKKSSLILAILFTCSLRLSEVSANESYGAWYDLPAVSSSIDGIIRNGQEGGNDLSAGSSSLFLSEEDSIFRNREFDYILDYYKLDPFSSGTGDVVGNGGGYLETLSSYYYQALDKQITTALGQNFLSFSNTEERILKRILNSLVLMREDKLRFISGKKAEAFFFIPGLDASSRLAKTGFSIHYPIYLNTELLYEKVKDKPVLILGLLIHELGHQVGVADHGILDNLAAKVVQLSTVIEEKIGSSLVGGLLEVTIYNYNNEAVPSDIFITYGDSAMKVVKWKPYQLRGVCAGDYMLNASVYNLHWSSRLVEPELIISAKGWVDIKCFNSNSGVFTQKHRDFEVEIDISQEEVKGKLKVTN